MPEAGRRSVRSNSLKSLRHADWLRATTRRVALEFESKVVNCCTRTGHPLKCLLEPWLLGSTKIIWRKPGKNIHMV